MSYIDIKGVQNALADFIDKRMLTALDKQTASTRWILGGASALFLSRLDKLAEAFTPLFTQMGVVDEDGHYDIDAVEMFLESAFEKQNPVTMPVLGVNFSFDKDDGDALIAMMKERGV